MVALPLPLSQGLGISCYECGPYLKYMKFSEENKRKIEAKEIPSFLIPCPLIVFETW